MLDHPYLHLFLWRSLDRVSERGGLSPLLGSLKGLSDGLKKEVKGVDLDDSG